MKFLIVIFFLLLNLGSYAQKAPYSARGIAMETPREPVAHVYDAPEVKASFKFGQDSLDHFIRQHIHFNNPGDKTAGKAIVVFIVEADGKIGNAEILSTSGNSNFDKDAVAVVKSMPAWKAAKNKGKVVRSSNMLSVSYQSK